MSAPHPELFSGDTRQRLKAVGLDASVRTCVHRPNRNTHRYAEKAASTVQHASSETPRHSPADARVRVVPGAGEQNPHPVRQFCRWRRARQAARQNARRPPAAAAALREQMASFWTSPNHLGPAIALQRRSTQAMAAVTAPKEAPHRGGEHCDREAIGQLPR